MTCKENELNCEAEYTKDEETLRGILSHIGFIFFEMLKETHVGAGIYRHMIHTSETLRIIDINNIKLMGTVLALTMDHPGLFFGKQGRMYDKICAELKEKFGITEVIVNEDRIISSLFDFEHIVDKQFNEEFIKNSDDGC